MVNKIFASLLIVLLIVLSFFREAVFVNINAHMWFLFTHNDKSYLAPWLIFLKPFDYAQLYWFKWGLTAAFSILFLFLTGLIIKLIFNEWSYVWWTCIVYGAFILISAISYMAGWLLNNTEDGYTISRYFMGLVQSPFLLVFLIPAFKLAGKGKSERESSI